MAPKFYADRPQANPSKDLLGYAPFAKNLAKSIAGYRGCDALVLGLYGAWGSGKSTILKYIQYYLNKRRENSRPIVIEFNPWWFSGQDKLARTFLGQLQAILPKRNAAFEKLGALLGEFSECIGGLFDVAGISNGLGKKTGKLIKKFVIDQPKDIQELKEEICNILRCSKKHIVIIIDDIDRLDAEEIRQLFTVIKALADFPNVIYLLAFDHSVVVRAIEQYSGMPGKDYLEKIIQVPFTMPLVDRLRLYDILFTHLDKIITGTPKHLFNRLIWDSIFYNGIENLFNIPRDVVRFCNTLSVTYPAVRGEVNAVEFIAIEAIRVFIPDLYMYIRNNPEYFVYSEYSKKTNRQEVKEKLGIYIPEYLYQSIEKVILILFPLINENHSDISDARRTMSVSIEKFFPNYFQFNPSQYIISNSEIINIIENLGDDYFFREILRKAKETGMSRLHELLDRLRDYDTEYISEEKIPSIIGVFLDIGDELIENDTDTKTFNLIDTATLTDMHIETLGLRLPLEKRLTCIEEAMRTGDALIEPARLLLASENAVRRGRDPLIPIEKIPYFKELWINKLDDKIHNNTLQHHENLMYILSFWFYCEEN